MVVVGAMKTAVKTGQTVILGCNGKECGRQAAGAGRCAGGWWWFGVCAEGVGVTPGSAGGTKAAGPEVRVGGRRPWASTFDLTCCCCSSHSFYCVLVAPMLWRSVCLGGVLSRVQKTAAHTHNHTSFPCPASAHTFVHPSLPPPQALSACCGRPTRTTAPALPAPLAAAQS